MKKFFKFIGYGIGALIVLGVIGSLMGEGEETASTPPVAETTAAASETKAKEDKPKEEAKEPAVATHGLGDVVKVGSMTYTIHGVSTAEQVGPSAFPTEAKGKYVILEVTAKNDGNEAVTLSNTFFNLKQGDKTFEADSMASMSANQSDDGSIATSFFLEQLNPGSELSGKVVFDVAPEIADAGGFSVEIQEGAFGTVTETINLK